MGRLAALHIMCVLITSSGVVAAAAKAPAAAPIAKSSCALMQYRSFSGTTFGFKGLVFFGRRQLQGRISLCGASAGDNKSCNA